MAIEIERSFYSQGKRVLIITGLHEKTNEARHQYIAVSQISLLLSGQVSVLLNDKFRNDFILLYYIIYQIKK